MEELAISFTLNGTLRTIHVPPTRRFADILRDDLGLTGTKISCGIGRCGACTVLQNGLPVNACLLMAYQVDGSSILTIEGLAEDGQEQEAAADRVQHGDAPAKNVGCREPVGECAETHGDAAGEGADRHGLSPDRTVSQALHPLQRAFLEAGGFQCGYCTPGMILAAKALLDASPNPTQAQIREALSGNLCRCTGYTGIFRAIELVVNSGHAKPHTAIDMEGEDVH
ncbi:(2Fe-2S)-binding protein [Alicyclobacillus ferrooxydans]|uniref:(2Fe-2S)-binding protein n=1 Tax=Alicyclobacillus ferrooxydans TaxID=471514 RepID=UPI0006D59925|nr:(2Fe-2S)-binding protein [Alicyclobacillus ferrooxydans]